MKKEKESEGRGKRSRNGKNKTISLLPKDKIVSRERKKRDDKGIS